MADPFSGPREGKNLPHAIVRTDLEAQLAEALEAVEWGRVVRKPSADSNSSAETLEWACPTCSALKSAGAHQPSCKLSLALLTFRGEGAAKEPG